MARRWIRIALGVFGFLLGLLLVVAFVGYRASQKVPEFYQEALEIDSPKLEEASDQMLQQVTRLASKVRKPGRWEARFTVEQINGWLAVDLVRNHAGQLPAGVSDPRVGIEPDAATVGCRVERDGWQSVVNLAVDVQVTEPNVVAVRVLHARAGAMPIPLKSLFDDFTRAAARAGLSVRWAQNDGDPVALITFPETRDGEGRQVRIEDIRLGEGEVYLSGSTVE